MFTSLIHRLIRLLSNDMTFSYPTMEICVFVYSDVRRHPPNPLFVHFVSIPNSTLIFFSFHESTLFLVVCSPNHLSSSPISCSHFTSPPVCVCTHTHTHTHTPRAHTHTPRAHTQTPGRTQRTSTHRNIFVIIIHASV